MFGSSFLVASTSVALAYGGPTGQAHVSHPAYPPKMTREEEMLLPMIGLDEVLEHKSADSLWVTYNGFVYDVTPFLDKHPGGKDLLLTAGGMDLNHFFTNYLVHTKSEKAINYLDGMKIGRLSAKDAARAKARSTPALHVENRMRVLGNARTRLCLVVALLPFILLIRTLVRIIGFVLPSVGHSISNLLPFSVPGYGDARKIGPTIEATVETPEGKLVKEQRKTRIAVIGGGIAGSGCAYTLARNGYDVTVYEARKNLSGNAHSFDWYVGKDVVKTCVSVTAWPPHLYKNYVALLKQIDVKTKTQTLSWFVNSKVPGHEGFLWAADPSAPAGSLREHFKRDFEQYGKALKLINFVTKLFTFQFGAEPSMYSLQTGLGPLNPFATFPLHHVARLFGVSQEWWDIVFTPHYTASFLTDKLDNMVAVTGPLIEDQIPLLPNDSNTTNCKITTCETWADAGTGMREVFAKLTKNCTVKVNTRVTDVSINPKNHNEHVVTDDVGGSDTFDRVVFACQATAIGNMVKDHNWMEDAILGTPEYADDHHPGTGHMHAVMHNDASIIDPRFREEVVRRGSNYVEVTKNADGTLNIENTYNFGVQTPSLVDREDRPPLLITHALGEGKSIDPKKIVGDGSHARAHPLYSGWNVLALLSLRLAQGRRGLYYCCNYTTPGNCHDMSLNSGMKCAAAIGAAYPFEGNVEARQDFDRLGTLMGI